MVSADGLLGELFEAMRTSHRGEFRKAPTVIQWAVSLKKLQARSGKAPHDAIAVLDSQAPMSDRQGIMISFSSSWKH